VKHMSEKKEGEPVIDVPLESNGVETKDTTTKEGDAEAGAKRKRSRWGGLATTAETQTSEKTEGDDAKKKSRWGGKVINCFILIVKRPYFGE
jgi:hypothetical protein